MAAREVESERFVTHLALPGSHILVLASGTWLLDLACGIPHPGNQHPEGVLLFRHSLAQTLALWLWDAGFLSSAEVNYIHLGCVVLGCSRSCLDSIGR